MEEQQFIHWGRFGFLFAIAGLIVLFFNPPIGIGVILFGIAWTGFFIAEDVDLLTLNAYAAMKALCAIIEELKAKG